MSNIESFQELLAKNDEVKGKIEKLVDTEGKSQDELIAGIIALAKEYGISLSEGDIQVEDQELSEEELTDVSGGLAGDIRVRYNPQIVIYRPGKNKIIN